jgi:hypothetical protein
MAMSGHVSSAASWDSQAPVSKVRGCPDRLSYDSSVPYGEAENKRRAARACSARRQAVCVARALAERRMFGFHVDRRGARALSAGADCCSLLERRSSVGVTGAMHGKCRRLWLCARIAFRLLDSCKRSIAGRPVALA